ncbi:MAG: FAD-dependent oxidoreductase, partial [Rubrivivax sp.]|nr:FAD-dependent oxidoreductase [Rubrivivax sp.]
INSTRSTDFITPKSALSKDIRNAVLTLAGEHAFARALVNSGRLSVPTHLSDSALNTPDAEPFTGLMAPGAPADDAPVALGGVDGWLLQQLGDRFVLMLFGDDAPAADLLQALARAALPVQLLQVAMQPGPVPTGGSRVVDTQGLAAQRFDARPGTCYLLRPDQHVAARWRRFDAAALHAALARACGRG